MNYLDTFLISLVSIILYILLDKIVVPKLANGRYFHPLRERWFYYSFGDKNSGDSGCVKGVKALVDTIEKYTLRYGFGVEFTIRETDKKEYIASKKNKKKGG